MPASAFDDLDSRFSSQGSTAVFDRLTGNLQDEKKYHDLFDVLLMRSRHELGLPPVLTTSLDDLAEPLRSRVEDAYLAACRKVGLLLLAEGQFREAWMYLRPVGEKGAMAEALRKTEPSAENLQDLVEIALHEGVAPDLGYGWVLANYGTCNAITTFEGALVQRPRADQQAAAALLVEHLHHELTANVRADIERREAAAPPAGTLAELVQNREELFADNNYHVDTTHLAATVRFARVLEAREPLELAYDLTEYGRRLSSQFQFKGDEPFGDVYPSHGLFFAAQLGSQVDEAIAYFGEKARTADVERYGTAPAEVYVALLARLKRYDEAIEAAIELVPAGVRTSGFSPSLFELARLSGRYDRLLAICRERGDLVGYAAALLERDARGG